MLAIGVCASSAFAAGPVNISFEKHGHGPAVILIPGLSCGGNVWDQTVKHLEGKYTCYVLTLPGFAGQPSIAAPYLASVRDGIENLVETEHLSKPWVIGHSLGGFMALYLTSDKPGMFGGGISVDGLPWLARAFNPLATPAWAQNLAATLQKQFNTMDDDELAHSMSVTLKNQISSQDDIDHVYPEVIKSDPKEVGLAASEMLVTDLSEQIAQIKCPFMLIAPDEFAKPKALKFLQQSYAHAIAANPKIDLAWVMHSKHFVMLDQPKRFYELIDGFMNKSSK